MISRWFGVVLAAGLLGLVGWRMGASSPPEARQLDPSSARVSQGAPEIAGESEPRVEHERAVRALQIQRKGDVDAPPSPAAPAEKLDPKSDEFARRLDIGIPNRLYAEVADRCYARGHPKDAMVKLSYRLRVMEGEIRIWDLKALESSIDDPHLEQCIRDAVANAGWRDDQMPNWDAEDELVVRLGGLKKHLAEDREDISAEPERDPLPADETMDTLGEQGD